MRQIEASTITDVVKNLVMDAEYFLPKDFIGSIEKAIPKEQSPMGQEILKTILDNAKVAAEEKVAYCQDTGYPVFFVDLGQDVHIVGGNLTDAINEGVRQATKEGYLRASLAYDPVLDRKHRRQHPSTHLLQHRSWG